VGNNTAIITDTAQAVTLENINNFGAGVFAHTTQDYAQHTQVQVYPTPYVIGSTTVTGVQINVSVYKNKKSITIHDATGKKVNAYSFVSFYGTLSATDIQFYQNFNGRWHPFGLQQFAADITGGIVAAASQAYTFTLASDDGSFLFIDGTQVIDNSGDHGIRARTGTIFLNSGNHVFEVQFHENGAGPSGVNLTLPNGVTYFTQTVTQQNIVSTLSLYLGLTYNGSLAGFALPINASGTDTRASSPPLIVAQPAQTVNAGIGDIAQFTVAVLSNIPVTYQWQRNAPVATPSQQTLKQQAQTLQTALQALPLTGYNAPQSTNKTRALQIAQRLVSELPSNQNTAPPFGAVTDAQALVPLVADATVSQEIQTLVTAIQTSIAQATGAGIPFTDIPNQTKPQITLTNVQTSDAASYRVIVANANGTAISSNGTLIVTAFKPAKKHK
jgi:hypothetical protein